MSVKNSFYVDKLFKKRLEYVSVYSAYLIINMRAIEYWIVLNSITSYEMKC